jgi:hypothetical protein
MLAQSLAVVVAAAIALPPLPIFDEGWDFLLLEMPRRAVLGDTLKFEVLGRPGNPYVVFADQGNTLSYVGPIPVHLNGSPAMFLAAAGLLPANGQTLHTLPAAAALDGATLFFQAFSADGGSYRGVTVSDGKR